MFRREGRASSAVITHVVKLLHRLDTLVKHLLHPHLMRRELDLAPLLLVSRRGSALSLESRHQNTHLPRPRIITIRTIKATTRSSPTNRPTPLPLVARRCSIFILRRGGGTTTTPTAVRIALVGYTIQHGLLGSTSARAFRSIVVLFHRLRVG